MFKLIFRILINAFALWVAAYFVEGVTLSGSVFNWLIIAVIFGLVNAFIRPLVRLLTLPINLVTLGLFTFVVNAFMLMVTAWISGWLGDGALSISGAMWGFIPALWASIIISIVSTVLNWFVSDD